MVANKLMRRDPLKIADLREAGRNGVPRGGNWQDYFY
jgi:hypothetical protein